MAVLKRKNYKFTNKKVSKIGVISTILLLFSVVLIGYGLKLSFEAHGEGGMTVGVLGAVGFLTSLAGLITGFVSLKEPEVFHSFSWIGAIGNAVICFFMLSLIMIGI